MMYSNCLHRTMGFKLFKTQSQAWCHDTLVFWIISYFLLFSFKCSIHSITLHYYVTPTDEQMLSSFTDFELQSSWLTCNFRFIRHPYFHDRGPHSMLTSFQTSWSNCYFPQSGRSNPGHYPNTMRALSFIETPEINLSPNGNLVCYHLKKHFIVAENSLPVFFKRENAPVRSFSLLWIKNGQIKVWLAPIGLLELYSGLHRLDLCST